MSACILQNSCPYAGRVKNTEVYGLLFLLVSSKNMLFWSFWAVFGPNFHSLVFMILERKFGFPTQKAPLKIMG